jgi:hypothetical protein
MLFKLRRGTYFGAIKGFMNCGGNIGGGMRAGQGPHVDGHRFTLIFVYYKVG